MRYKGPLLIILCLVSASVIAPQFTTSTLHVEINPSQNNAVASDEESNATPLVADLVDTNSSPESVEMSNLSHLTGVYPLDISKWPNDEISEQVIIPDSPESFDLVDNQFHANDIFPIPDLRVASNVQHVFASIDNPADLGITKSLTTPDSEPTNDPDAGDDPTSGITEDGDGTPTSQTNPTEDNEIVASNNDNASEEQKIYDDSTRQYLDPPTKPTVSVPTPSGFMLFVIGLLGLMYQQRQQKLNKIL